MDLAQPEVYTQRGAFFRWSRHPLKAFIIKKRARKNIFFVSRNIISKENINDFMKF